MFEDEDYDNENRTDEDYDECDYCAGKGYLRECPIDMGADSRSAHSGCPFCGGEYYGKFICPQCHGSGRL